jgi:hypothetical protein
MIFWGPIRSHSPHGPENAPAQARLCGHADILNKEKQDGEGNKQVTKTEYN